MLSSAAGHKPRRLLPLGALNLKPGNENAE